MFNIIYSVIAFITRKVLSFRYEVLIVDNSKLINNNGTLLLANHPALVDPIILVSHLWEKYTPKPIVLEKYYNSGFFGCLIKLTKAVPMPDMSCGGCSPYKVDRINKALTNSAEALRNKENVLLYPSGQISRTGKEDLTGKSAVKKILEIYPNPKILCITTSGLYGSIFSKAYTPSQTPDLLSCLKQGMIIALKNFLFFIPKRKVRIEINDITDDILKLETSDEINEFLESQFNKIDCSKISRVSYSFLKEEVIKQESNSMDNEGFKKKCSDNKTLITVKNIISKYYSISVENLKPETQLTKHLGLDSIQLSELLVKLSREFEVDSLTMEDTFSLASIVNAIENHQNEDQPKDTDLVDAHHVDEEKRNPPKKLEAKTITKNFLNISSSFSDQKAISDKSSGDFSYKRLRYKCFVFSSLLKDIEDENIGILLPSSVISTITYISILLAGKKPVIFNWTSGTRNLSYAVESSNVNHIITSEKFLDKIQQDLCFLSDKFLLLETIKKKIKFIDIIKCYFYSVFPNSLIKNKIVELNQNEDDTAVCLFTSGSEARPKMVELSHKNLIANINYSFKNFNLNEKDVVICILPSFHSFGLTVCTLLPLLTGLKTIFHSDPNESKAIARLCRENKATILLGTPTFISSILSQNDKDCFKSLRYIICGGEKTPDELYKLLEGINPNTQLIQGYGITECSPVISFNKINQKPVGVGSPLECLEVLIVNPDTLEEVIEGTAGLILVRGDSVFKGYTDKSIKSPFIEIKNKFWYNTQDIGYIKSKSIVLTGRLKRFIKIAGEMISLPAIEEFLNNKFGTGNLEQNIAIISITKQQENSPKLYMVTTLKTEIDKDSINEALLNAGFPNLAKIQEIMTVAEFPVLGSGKIDLFSLEQLLKKD